MATSLVCLGLSILTPVEGYLSFLSNSDTVGLIASYIIAFLVLTALFRLNLFFATNIKNTLAVSIVLSGLLVLTTYGFVSFQEQDKFNSNPMYATALKPPFSHLGKEYSIDAYFRDLKIEVDLLDTWDKE